MLETTPLRLWISSKSNRVQVRVFVVSATKMHHRTFVAVTVRRNKLSRKILTFKMTNVSNPFLRFFFFFGFTLLYLLLCVHANYTAHVDFINRRKWWWLRRLFIYVDAVGKTCALQRASDIDAAAPYVVLWLASAHHAGSHRSGTHSCIQSHHS